MTASLVTAAGLASFAGLLLMAFFVIVPAANTWFTSQSADVQQSVIGIVILAVAAIFLFLNCFQFLFEIPCTVQSIGDYLLNVVIAAVLGNKVTQFGFTGVRMFQDGRANQSATKNLSAKPVRPAGKLL